MDKNYYLINNKCKFFHNSRIINKLISINRNLLSKAIKFTRIAKLMFIKPIF